MKKLIPMAICYDFDGTLSPGNMQEYGFMDSLKIKREDFWKEVRNIEEREHVDNIAAYMKLMISKSEEMNIPFSKDTIKQYGKQVKLFKGVLTWFDRINKYAKKKKVLLKHYIISSGIKEMIEGMPINKAFTKIYASTFMYDANNVPIWPGIVLNFTTKTRYLFEINKGSEKVNTYKPDYLRAVPFSNMIYIGDGETDVPCMRIVKEKGGHAIAVYTPKSKNKKEKAEELIYDGRVDFITFADYSKNKKLEQYVEAIIDKVVSNTNVQRHSMMCMAQAKRNLKKRTSCSYIEHEINKSKYGTKILYQNLQRNIRGNCE